MLTPINACSKLQCSLTPMYHNKNHFLVLSDQHYPHQQHNEGAAVQKGLHTVEIQVWQTQFLAKAGTGGQNPASYPQPHKFSLLLYSRWGLTQEKPLRCCRGTATSVHLSATPDKRGAFTTPPSSPGLFVRVPNGTQPHAARPAARPAPATSVARGRACAPAGEPRAEGGERLRGGGASAGRSPHGRSG